MVRASRVLNLQWLVARAALRSVTKSLDFPLESLLVGEPLFQAGAGQYTELDVCHVQPTSMLGGICLGV